MGSREGTTAVGTDSLAGNLKRRRAARAKRPRLALATLKSFLGGGPGHLEISDDVDIGSRRDRVARGGGSPFTESNIRVIYHLAVANAREGVREAICAP